MGSSFTRVKPTNTRCGGKAVADFAGLVIFLFFTAVSGEKKEEMEEEEEVRRY